MFCVLILVIDCFCCCDGGGGGGGGGVEEGEEVVVVCVVSLLLEEGGRVVELRCKDILVNARLALVKPLKKEEGEGERTLPYNRRSIVNTFFSHFAQ